MGLAGPTESDEDVFTTPSAEHAEELGRIIQLTPVIGWRGLFRSEETGADYSLPVVCFALVDLAKPGAERGATLEAMVPGAHGQILFAGGLDDVLLGLGGQGEDEAIVLERYIPSE